MAGTIFGVPLSQRVDGNGKPLAGWLVYLYVQNSSTPVDSFQDTALTVKNTWPVAADAAGMMLPFWLPDGSYRARGTSADGSLTLFDITSVLAIGPSGGGTVSGGVDPTAVFQTGDVIWLDFQGPRTGWVRDNGGTLGSASSGATEGHDSSCQPLFLYLWTNFLDAICPVVGGRGSTALNDWNANKKITLPDKRGYIPGGLDDMGNTAAGRWASVPVTVGNATTPGAQLGENRHTLLKAELPNYSLAASIGVTIPSGQGSHTHTLANATAVASSIASGGQVNPAGTNMGFTSIANATLPAMSGTAAGSVPSGGSGTALNVAQRTVLGTFYRKL